MNNKMNTTMNTPKMKAIVSGGYGSPEVLQLQEVEIPTPKDNEVLIKVVAASVTAADSMIRKGSPYIGRLYLGLRKPKHPIPGTGFAGVVESVGNAVSSFKVGDEVFGESISTFGTHAEYVCLAETGVLLTKPANISFEEAAGMCDGALTSMNFLKELANIRQGQKVLINGASGSLGTAAVQLAKHYGAVVTGVCSTSNVIMVQSLGADKVIDYTKQDFTTSEEQYDIIYDTVGKSSFSRCKEILSEDGVYMSPVLSLRLLFQMITTSISGSQKAKFSATGARPVPELRRLFGNLKEIIEAGKLRSIVDRRYSLDEAREAHAYVDTGRKRGNVVLRMGLGA